MTIKQLSPKTRADVLAMVDMGFNLGVRAGREQEAERIAALTQRPDSDAARSAEVWADQLPVGSVVRAREMMRNGSDLHSAALAIGTSSRALDLALWESLNRYGRPAA